MVREYNVSIVSAQRMFGKGFRFGLLLQFAIGPVCLYVLKIAMESGEVPAFSAIIAATIVDGLFASLAILGMGPLLDKPKAKSILKYFGVIILTYFGCGIILGELGINIVPGIGSSAQSSTASAFAAGLVLTAANPLTILFWAAVFATKVSAENYDRMQVTMFAAGAVSTTLIFLGALSLLAGSLRRFLTPAVILWMNILVGGAILIFAAKIFFSKDRTLIQESLNGESHER